MIRINILPLRELEIEKDPIPEDSIDLDGFAMTDGELSDAMMFREFELLKANDIFIARDIARIEGTIDEILKLVSKNGELLSQLLNPNP